LEKGVGLGRGCIIHRGMSGIDEDGFCNGVSTDGREHGEQDCGIWTRIGFSLVTKGDTIHATTCQHICEQTSHEVFFRCHIL
jgi:hypothetical protein